LSRITFHVSRFSSMPQQHFTIPDLRLVPIEALILHEHADEKRVARLQARLQADGYLKNPPIVAPIPNRDEFVVLDGANRTSAVRRAGYPHILVQVVDYKSEQVRLNTWNHLVTGRDPTTFLGEIRELRSLDVEKARSSDARARLRNREILAYAIIPSMTGDASPTIYTIDGAASHGGRGLIAQPTG
jgi:ParB-like nuclease domain.